MTSFCCLPGREIIGGSVQLAKHVNPGPWREYSSDNITGIPRQQDSNNCGVFVLMYALYIVMEGHFDFNESDMLTIRRWWCMLLLTNYPLKSDAERKELRKKRRVERADENPPAC